MKAKYFLLLMGVAMAATSAFSQGRVKSVTVKNANGQVIESSTPLAGRYLRPLGNKLTADIECVYPAGNDLSNVTVEVGPNYKDASPVVVFGDWTEKRNVEVPDANGINATATVYLKEVKKTALPFEMPTTDLANWNDKTVGWAGACIYNDSKNAEFVFFKADAQFQTSSLVIAFNDVPEFLEYDIAAVDIDQDGMCSNLIFDVEESVDGIQWTTLVQYVGADVTEPTDKQKVMALSTSPEAIRLSLLASTRYVRWCFTSSVYGKGGKDNVLLKSATVTKNPDQSVGIFDAEKNGVSLRSSVIEDLLSVRSEAAVSSLAVYNMNGMVIAEARNIDQMNISHLVAGYYFAKVTTEDGRVAALRFMKK